MSFFKFKSFDYLPDFKFSSVLSIPAQLIGNGLVTVANTVNTVLDVVSPLGLAGNALLGKPFQVVHELGDKIVDGVTSAVSDVGSALGATVEAKDTHHKNEWVDQELTLDNILKAPGELIGNVVIGATNIVNDVLDAAAPVAILGNNIIPGFEPVHKAGDTIIDAVSDTLNTIGQAVGGTVQPNDTHYDNEWTEAKPGLVTGIIDNVVDKVTDGVKDSPIFNYLPDFKTSSVLSIPAQLIGNGLVTVANTVNTVLDVVSPLGLAGNALLGKPFQVVHELGDKIIDGLTSTVSDVGSALGATVEAKDTHHKNEWVDQELTLDNILKVPSEVIGNALIGTTNVANDLLDAVAPLGLAGNKLLPGFEIAHKVGDTIIDKLSDILTTVGTGLGGTVPVDPTHFDNEWPAGSVKPTLPLIPNPPTEPSPATKQNSVDLLGQKSYLVSDATFRQVQELYAKFSEAPSLKVSNLWRPIYTAIKNDLASNDAVDQGTKNWLKVAEAVATADPTSFLYQYVRLGTEKSLAEKGITFTNEDFYQASNVLIKTLADNFLNGVKDAAGNQVVPVGYLPSSDGKFGLVHMDATQALNNLGGTLSDWTGITPASILDHYLGVDTSELNGGDSRPFTWYVELLGDVVKANLKAGASLFDVVGQITTEGLNFVGQFINGELLQNGFSSKDQLVNTLTQIAYAYAGDFAGTVAVATNILNPNTNIVSTINPFGTTLNGKAGNDIIKGGIGNDKLYGGKGDDLLLGGWGNDILDGGEGINVLAGGRGNDSYYVKSNNEFVLEHVNEGTDTVFSAATNYVLSKNIENLTLQGNDNINGTGNAADNIIKGNLGNNSLFGGAGNDTLDANGGLINILNGGAGNDQLIGGLGDETYAFELGFGVDTIYEKGGNDTILFGKGINVNDLLVNSSGKDLVINLQNGQDKITIKDWAVNDKHQVETIQFHTGERYDLTDLDQKLNFI